MDNFNHIILYLQGVDVIIDDVDQALSLFYSLMNLCYNFVDTMLYGRIKITFNNMKDALLYKELKYKVSGRECGNKGRSHCKYKPFVQVKCHQCKE